MGITRFEIINCSNINWYMAYPIKLRFDFRAKMLLKVYGRYVANSSKPYEDIFQRILIEKSGFGIQVGNKQPKDF